MQPRPVRRVRPGACPACPPRVASLAVAHDPPCTIELEIVPGAEVSGAAAAADAATGARGGAVGAEARQAIRQHPNSTAYEWQAPHLVS